MHIIVNNCSGLEFSYTLHFVLAVSLAFSPAGYIPDFAQGDVYKALALTVCNEGVVLLCLFEMFVWLIC